MWPLTDPITQQKAVLVCEQNISQVKALEEQFKKQNQRLEAQLEEALAQRDPVHKPAIDIDTPADKTLKLLDKIMRGHEVWGGQGLWCLMRDGQSLGQPTARGRLKIIGCGLVPHAGLVAFWGPTDPPGLKSCIPTVQL